MRDLDALEPGQVALLGVPWDAHSSFLRGPALAPTQIRAALHSGAMNLTDFDWLAVLNSATYSRGGRPLPE